MLTIKIWRGRGMRRSPFELRYRNIEVVDTGPILDRNVELLAKLIRAVALRKLEKARTELQMKKAG
jgi:hypothetical protein